MGLMNNKKTFNLKRSSGVCVYIISNRLQSAQKIQDFIVCKKELINDMPLVHWENYPIQLEKKRCFYVRIIQSE